MIELDVDSVDLLDALDEQKAEYLLVGAHALAAYGVVRATSDVDIMVSPTLENSKLVYAALVKFGAPVAAHGLDPAYFSQQGRVYQIGLAPRRIDLLSSISGVAPDDAFSTARFVEIAGVPRRILSRELLIKNKRATGRLKDLADVERLEQTAAREPGRPH